MKKAILFSILAVYVNSCDLFDRSCSCTAVACFQGIRVVLINNPDSLLYRDFNLRISYSDTVESTSEVWGMGIENEFMFSSYKLRKERPVQIQILMDYISTAGPAHFSFSQPVGWESFVCNQCSGNARSCKDEINYSAVMEIDLDSIIVE